MMKILYSFNKKGYEAEFLDAGDRGCFR